MDNVSMRTHPRDGGARRPTASSAAMRTSPSPAGASLISVVTVMVHGLLPHASPPAIERLLKMLPEGATGEYDPDVNAVVIELDDRPDLANQVHGVLADSGLVGGGPGSEEAVLKYLPHRALQPAYWDELEATWAICTTCDWHAVADTPAALETEMRRHADRVHGGRTDQ